MTGLPASLRSTGLDPLRNALADQPVSSNHVTVSAASWL
jgi:hypothetical protein